LVFEQVVEIHAQKDCTDVVYDGIYGQ